jgi:hypothetical protein
VRSLLLLFLPILLLLSTACGGDDGGNADAAGSFDAGCPALPSDGVYATFRVTGEIYHQSITNPTGIDQALSLWAGTSTADIPNGELSCTPSAWNCGYTWHVSPGSVQFADLTTEVCDGQPSYVEANCATFATMYCPWLAELIELRDCRTDPSCPPVPR